uniref:MFS domain-containing protein n=1 Tax=Trichuris muris TaxID=70415 RepID=A0A5S6QAJ4_TRIMR
MERQEEENETNFQALLSMTGDWSYYQWILLPLLTLPGCLAASWVGYSQVFAVASPSHWCHPPINVTEFHLTETQWKNMAIPLGPADFSSCKQYAYKVDGNSVIINKSAEQDCSHGWRYDHSLYDETLVTEMGLVCSADYWPALTMIIFNSGSVVGNLFFGHITDRYGRKKALFLCVATSSLFSIASSLVVDVKTFAVMRFLAGLSFPAIYATPVILAFELIGDRYRIPTNTLFSTMFGASTCALGIVANYVRNWRVLLVVSSMPGTLFLLCWRFIPESPRWLISKRQFSQATDTLISIAARNKKLDRAEDIRQACMKPLLGDNGNWQGDKSSLVDLFKTPSLRRITFLVTLIWLVNSTVYNGLLYNVPNMKLNDYTSFMLSGAVEVPASLMTWPLMNSIGRRWSLTLTMGFGGVSTLLVPALANVHSWALGVLATVGKFAITASFGILYAYANELYPTTVRGIGISFSSLTAMICVMLEPYVLYAVNSKSPTLPLAIMGALSSTAALLSLFLPETKGAHLPETVEELAHASTVQKDSKIAAQPESLVVPL